MSADAIARLRELATRLAAAPEYTAERAAATERGTDPDMAARGRLAYQAGALEQICRSSASEIESIIRLFDPAQREADLRDAFLAGCEHCDGWFEENSRLHAGMDPDDIAAAEYARVVAGTQP